jgi:hypothetical protein
LTLRSQLANLNQEEYQLYLHAIVISQIVDSHFGVKDLGNRLESLNVDFSINEKMRRVIRSLRQPRMQFLNHLADDPRLGPDAKLIEPEYGPFRISARIPVRLFNKQKIFRLHVFTYVSVTVPDRDRRLTALVVPKPTALFTQKLKRQFGEPTKVLATLRQPVILEGVVDQVIPDRRGSQMPKLRTLFVAANPQGTTQLALDQEIRQITRKIRLSDGRDVLEVISVWAVEPSDLLQYLNQYKPQIVHFSGHGTTAGEIILVNKMGAAKPVSAQALKSLFSTMKDNIQLVVLNACYSRIQGTAIKEVIDFVIGMNAAIGDEAAIVFAAALYSALGFNRTIAESFDQAKTALLLEGIREENTPELLVRSGATPAARLGASAQSASNFGFLNTIDRGSLRTALSIGWQLARYEFADGSPIPEAAAAAKEIRQDIDDLLKRDGLVAPSANERAQQLIKQVLSTYSAKSPERQAAILIGIGGLRSSLVGASGNDDHNKELAQVARSAIMEIDPSLITTHLKPAYFDALLNARPQNINELLVFVDRSM